MSLQLLYDIIHGNPKATRRFHAFATSQTLSFSGLGYGEFSYSRIGPWLPCAKVLCLLNYQNAHEALEQGLKILRDQIDYDSRTKLIAMDLYLPFMFSLDVNDQTRLRSACQQRCQLFPNNAQNLNQWLQDVGDNWEILTVLKTKITSPSI